MSHSPLRRRLLLGALALPFMPRLTYAQINLQDDLHRQLKALETTSQGRLGLALIDTAEGRQVAYRGGERFAFCSTVKVLAVGAILRRSMAEPTLLQQRIQFSQQQVTDSSYAPITSKHIADGMTIAELCAAAISYSDNAAMNLLLDALATRGAQGAQAVTAYARTLGDMTFRLDRSEPALNTAIPGDPRDTSTPQAMAMTIQRLVLGDALAESQRGQLQTWLKGNTTGDKRIRAGVPAGWQVGDKTGTGSYGTTNDLAVIWPPARAPMILAIYFTQTHKDAAPRDEVIAAATRIVMSGYAE